MKHKVYVRREKNGLGNPEAYRIIMRAVKAALSFEGVREACSVSVLLTDDEGIRRINNDMRGRNEATDVLSFPMNELIPGSPDFSGAEREGDGRVALGDMAFSLERARMQGSQYGHGFQHETAYLTVHSVLHLLGYDHLDEGDEKHKMRAREKAIMAEIKTAGIKNDLL